METAVKLRPPCAEGRHPFCGYKDCECVCHQSKRNKPKGNAFVGFLILAALGYGAFVLAKAVISGKPDNAAKSSVVTPTQSYKVGDTITTGYWTYRVVSSRWAHTIGSYPVGETADAEFLIVRLEARNNDDSASILPTMNLIDEHGRTYSESEKSVVLPEALGVLKQVNPRVWTKGVAVFDVPQESYSIVLSGGNLSGDSILVALQ